MSGFVEQLFKMSLTAAIVIVVVLLIRFLMRKFPKKYLYLLWATVWFRLLCPVSIESKLSIFNLTHKAGEAAQVQNAAADPDQIGNIRARMRIMANVRRHLAQMEPGSNPSHVTEAASAADKVVGLDPKTVFMVIWVTVAVLILGYAVFHIVKLKRKLRDSREVGQGIYESPFIDSPIAVGIVKPKIYIPTDVSEGELKYLIEHERVHIKRGDLIFKMFAVIAVALHWFNPLAWIAFALFCRDMEMGCDEVVLERLGDGIRKSYSLSLVTMAEKNSDKAYLVMPTSFGKNSVGKTEVKMRIDNILHFKKSSALATAIAGVTVIGVGLACGLNAYADTDSDVIEDSAPTEVVEDSAPADEETADNSSADVEANAGVPASQLDYMVAYPDWESLDYDRFAYDDYCIEDMSLIEDEDLRELAQYYYDQGFYINNPETIQYFGTAPGDDEYMFRYGFHADSGDAPADGSYVYMEVDVYKMDEDLFNYYIIDNHDYISYCVDNDTGFDEITDDGTVIRATYTIDNFVYTYEFNRDTQIAIMSTTKVFLAEEDYAVTPDPITDDLSVIEDETMRDLAQSYVDQGYVIWADDTDLALFTDDGSHYISAFTAVWQDGNSCISVQAVYMDQALFDSYVTAYEEFGTEYTIEDDGTVERLTASSDDCCGYLEFNRDTGIGVYVFEF